ncbi:LOW QUALITY PROTEIN: olfactory receptor 9I1-like [Hylobates moloch]|uniref:LOW QUALITY PROTEIN: olfactory receptor 9I1-like n=1 Tax=Hylobates moloch TaxID=81572 RepID=UPI00136453A7|nr:LOW QUALITY PROTEIN: olfactory receptor 9I1-like [Hylobates moloch]XP_032004438.1 LOW QUALITY PROTEIN: olfactory receptor 9I1-like [Hylobates moloch]
MAENGTMVTEFVLMGFRLQAELQIGLFFVFLVIFLITMGGNLGMIVLIQTDPRLQTPMYFFLSHLSFLDICYSSVIVPQLLETLETDKMIITYERCASQFFFFTLCASTECFLLAVMAYDRYMAVCNPLLYAIAMTSQTRLGLVAGAYSRAIVNSVIRTGCTFSISFCKSNHVDFFFCDLPPLLKLACSETRPREWVIYLLAFLVITTSISVILTSYLFIIQSILKIRTAGGKAKTFSTCTSHMAAVTLFFGTLIFIYLKGNMGESLEEDKIVSVFYTVVIPMLNPMIYSLRNKDMKEALKKVFNRLRVSQAE